MIRMRVSITVRIAQQGTVLAHKDKVHAPCVDADRSNLNALVCHHLQPSYYLIVESIDVPVEVSSCLDYLIRETSEFALYQLAVNDDA